MQNSEISYGKKITWWQRNKKKILIAGGVVLVVAGGILFYKNWDTVIDLAMTALRKGKKASPQPIEVHVETPIPKVAPLATKPISQIINGGEPFPVNGHIRNLPEFCTPSPEQKALAEALGIPLGEHQTYIRPYIKNCA